MRLLRSPNQNQYQMNITEILSALEWSQKASPRDTRILTFGTDDEPQYAVILREQFGFHCVALCTRREDADMILEALVK